MKDINWNRVPEFTEHALTFKPGDFIMLRPETKGIHWYDEFIEQCGPGPWKMQDVVLLRLKGKI